MGLIDAHAMRQDIVSYINGVISKSVIKTQKNTYDEAQIIANMVFYFANEFRLLSEKYKGYGVTACIGSVFVHQRPYITLTGTPCKRNQRIEIGDLLLLFKHRTKDSAQWRRSSLLLQAKRALSLEDNPGNKDQHCLYAYWPKFEYANKKDFPDTVREVTGPLLNKGSKYLYIHDKGDIFDCPLCCFCFSKCFYSCSTVTMEAVPTSVDNSTGLINPRCFTSELYDFMFGNAGRPFFYGARNGKGWSRVMTDLIDVTAKQTVGKMGTAGATNSARGQGVMCYLSGDAAVTGSNKIQFAHSASDSSHEPPWPPPEKELNHEPEYGRGISIVEFAFIDEVSSKR